MSKISVADTAKRKEFARKLWTKDPKMSIPKMNAAIKKEFKGMVNTQNLYKWRTEFWEQHGMTGAEQLQRAQNEKLKGRPALPRPIGMPGRKGMNSPLNLDRLEIDENPSDREVDIGRRGVMMAARPPTMPENSFETTTFRIHSEQEGELLQKCFDYLNRIQFCDVKVVEFTPNFAIFSR